MKQFESGRSMVEVLAMLAIAGIIGAAGVGGYTVAMKKHRANELIHEAAGRALAVSQQLAVDRKLDEIDFGGYPNNDTGHGKFSDKPIPLAGGEFFKIPITGMDQAGCEQLKVMAGGSLRRVDCKDDGNGKVTADLIYQKDLSASVGTIPEDTSGDSENPSTSGTGNSVTRSYDNNRSGCEGAGYQYCSNNICITKEEVCETGSALCADTYPGTSEDNTGGYAGEVEGKACRCPSQQAFNQNDKKCIPACSGHGTLNENEDCVCQGGYCGVVCENQVDCGEHGTWTPDKCECDANWYGPLCDSDCDGFKGNSGSCYSCSDTSGISTSDAECAKCDGTAYQRFRSNGGTCYPCSWSASEPTTECAKCDNTNYPREMYNNRCALTTAGCNTLYPEAWFRDNLGRCYSCSSSTNLIFTSADECARCDNTNYPREMYNNHCVITIGACHKLYPGVGGVLSDEHSCYECSYPWSFSTTADECDQCGNLRYYSNGKCYKK